MTATTVTERTIAEQFPLWNQAPRDIPVADPDIVHVVVGCGTSVHIADSIAATLNRHGVQARAVPGNEWTRRPGDYIPSRVRPHVIVLSRSGESTETVDAAKASRAAGLSVTALTCAPGSSICDAADRVIVAETHPEEGIVMTASASLMLMMGLRFAGVAVTDATTHAAKALLAAAGPVFSTMIEDRSHFVLLGGGNLYGIAREGALKLQEMSLAQSEAHHPLEYRHGPISLIDDRSLVVLMYHSATNHEEAVLAKELLAKGARVIGLGGPGDVAFDLPEGAPENVDVRGLICLPALQLLGERIAGLRGLDTRQPRHLTKVVVTS